MKQIIILALILMIGCSKNVKKDQVVKKVGGEESKEEKKTDVLGKMNRFFCIALQSFQLPRDHVFYGY